MDQTIVPVGVAKPSIVLIRFLSYIRRVWREEAEGELLVNIHTRMPGSSAPVP
jgi:hypothetical protein